MSTETTGQPALPITTLAHADQALLNEAAHYANQSALDPAIGRALGKAAQDSQALAALLLRVNEALEQGDTSAAQQELRAVLRSTRVLDENEERLLDAVQDAEQPLAAYRALCPSGQLSATVTTDSDALQRFEAQIQSLLDALHEIKLRAAERRHLLAGRDLQTDAETAASGRPRLSARRP